VIKVHKFIGNNKQQLYLCVVTPKIAQVVEMTEILIITEYFYNYAPSFGAGNYIQLLLKQWEWRTETSKRGTQRSGNQEDYSCIGC